MSLCNSSHEIQKIELLDYDELAKIVDMDAVNAFRKRGFEPLITLKIRGTAQNLIFSSRLVKQ